jgi:hypothetical protein
MGKYGPYLKETLKLENLSGKSAVKIRNKGGQMDPTSIDLPQKH